jgi:hypothetical protein
LRMPEASICRMRSAIQESDMTCSVKGARSQLAGH